MVWSASQNNKRQCFGQLSFWLKAKMKMYANAHVENMKRKVTVVANDGEVWVVFSVVCLHLHNVSTFQL